jgi:hypothetical protein
MKRSAWPWVLAACGLSFGVASWLSSRRAPPVDDGRIAALEKRLEELSRDRGAIAGTSSRSVGTLQRPNGTVRMPERSQSVDNEPSQGELQAQYARESVDSRWAPAAEIRLMQVARTDAILSIEVGPPASQRIDCRSTTCRMEFTFAKEADATDWTLAYLTGVGNNLSRARYFIDRQPDGSVRVTMYGYK